MNQPITAYEVAAFTHLAGQGSLTGVVLNAEGLSNLQLQRIAQLLGIRSIRNWHTDACLRQLSVLMRTL